MNKKDAYIAEELGTRNGKRSRSMFGVIFVLVTLFVAVSTVYGAEEFTNWYQYSQISFTYDNDTPLTNFPVLVVLNSTNIADFAYSQFASTNGYDLRFSASDQITELNYEIEKWNTNGSSYVWVQVPALSSNAYIYAYWGNSDATVQETYCTDGSTWEDKYVGVWHLSETSGQHQDSTANNNDSSSVTVTTQGAATGKIDGADDFDGTDDSITIPALSLSTNTVTWEAWVKGYKAGYAGIIFMRGADTHISGMNLYNNKMGWHWLSDNAYADSMTLPSEQWVHMAIVVTPTRIYAYTNGVNPAGMYWSRTVNNEAFSSADLKIGEDTSETRHWDGIIDEARFSKVNRTNNWLRACYLNQASNSTFNVYGPTCFRVRKDDLAYKMKIIFTGYTGSETLTNFPALVVLNTNLTDFAYNQFVSSTGGDLRFADSNEMWELNYEVEEWNTNGNSYAWVQVPKLSGTNTFIWAYWGNPANSTAPSCTTNGSTWDSKYVGVWHLNETDGVYIFDSTTNSHDGIAANGLTLDATGKVDGGDTFDDSNDYTTFGEGPSLSGTTDLTLEAWIKPSGAGELIQQRDAVGYYGAYRFQVGASYLSFTIWNGDSFAFTGTNNVMDGSWHSVVAQRKGNDGHIYVDGVLDTSASGAAISLSSSLDTAIGQNIRDFNNPFGGIMDEVRISSSARSADWLWACWMNQASNTVFNNYGAISNYSILLMNNDATSVFGTSATMNGDLRSNGGNATTIYLYYGTNDGGTNASSWMTNINFGVKAVGLLSTNMTDLLDDQTYYYRYYGTNTGGKYRWGAPVKSFNTVLLEGLVLEVE